MAKVTQEVKPWWQSRTLAFNIITLILGFLEVWTGVYPVDPEVLVALNGFGNVLLRFITKAKLDFS